MTHPSLDNYAVDGDYCEVDNRNPTTEQARDAVTDGSDGDGSAGPAPSADYQAPDTPPDDRNSTRGQYTNMSNTRDDSYLLYQGQATNKRREVGMVHGAEAPSMDDGRSVTRTWWYDFEVPQNRYQTFKRLQAYQTGQWASERMTQNNQADNRRAVETFSDRLGCSDYQQTVAQSIIDQTNLSHLGTYSHRTAALGALSIATFLTDQWFLTDTKDYHDLREELGASVSDMRNVRSLLRQKSGRLQ